MLRLRFLLAVAAFVLLGLSVLWAGTRYQSWSEAREALEMAEGSQFDAALPVLLSLHERRPRDAAVVRALALGYYHSHQLVATEKFLDRWCELQPSETEPFLRRLQFRMMQQKVAASITDAEHIL